MSPVGSSGGIPRPGTPTAAPLLPRNPRGFTAFTPFSRFALTRSSTMIGPESLSCSPRSRPRTDVQVFVVNVTVEARHVIPSNCTVQCYRRPTRVGNRSPFVLVPAKLLTATWHASSCQTSRFSAFRSAYRVRRYPSCYTKNTDTSLNVPPPQRSRGSSGLRILLDRCTDDHRGFNDRIHGKP